jgi:hypothetical protein
MTASRPGRLFHLYPERNQCLLYLTNIVAKRSKQGGEDECRKNEVSQTSVSLPAPQRAIRMHLLPVSAYAYTLPDVGATHLTEFLVLSLVTQTEKKCGNMKAIQIEQFVTVSLFRVPAIYKQDA